MILVQSSKGDHSSVDNSRVDVLVSGNIYRWLYLLVLISDVNWERWNVTWTRKRWRWVGPSDPADSVGEAWHCYWQVPAMQVQDYLKHIVRCLFYRYVNFLFYPIKTDFYSVEQLSWACLRLSLNNYTLLSIFHVLNFRLCGWIITARLVSLKITPIKKDHSFDRSVSHCDVPFQSMTSNESEKLLSMTDQDVSHTGNTRID